VVRGVLGRRRRMWECLFEAGREKEGGEWL